MESQYSVEEPSTTPKRLLASITSSLTPHIHSLLDPSLSFPHLCTTVLPSLTSILTSPLPSSPSPPPHPSHRAIHPILPPPLDWPSITLSLQSTLDSLHTAVLNADHPLALSFFFSVAESCTLLPLLLPPSFPSQCPSSPLPQSLQSTLVAFHASTLDNFTDDSFPLPLLRSARLFLSQPFTHLLLHSSPPPESDEAVTAFATLAELQSPPALASVFLAYIHHRFPLPSPHPAWPTLIDDVLRAFTASVPVLTGVMMAAMEGEAMVETIEEAFVTPVVMAMKEWVKDEGWGYEAYSTVIPHLCRLSSHLSTLTFTYLSLTLSPARLPPPPSVSAFIASLPALQFPSSPPLLRTLDDLRIHSTTAGCIEQCDAVVAVMGGGGWGTEGVQEVLNALQDRMLKCAGGEEGKIEGGRGFGDLLIDLTSLSCVHIRWAEYSHALSRPPQVQSSTAVKTSTVGSILSSASFSSQLAALLEVSDRPRVGVTVAPLSLTKRSTLTPLTPSQPPVSAEGFVDGSARLHAAVLQAYNRCEAALRAELALVCDSYDLQGWSQTRDLPLSLHSRVTQPSPTLLHLSFYLHSINDSLRSVLGSSDLSSRWIGRLAVDAALLWVGRTLAVKVSRWWSRHFRLDILALILILSRYRLPLSHPHPLPLLDAAIAWLIICLGILEAPRRLIHQLLTDVPVSAVREGNGEVTAVLVAFEGEREGEEDRAEGVKGWMEVPWLRVWSEAEGAKCQWELILTPTHIHSVLSSLGLTGTALSSWIRKRYDLQLQDFPSLTGEEEEEAEALMKAVERWEVRHSYVNGGQG